MIVAVKTERNPRVSAFAIETKKRLLKGLPIEKINLKSNIKVMSCKTHSVLIYGYKIIGEEILRMAGLIAASVILVLGGINFFLLIPLVFFFLSEIVMLLGYLLVLKGLRKAGYKGKVKLLFNRNALQEVLFNVSI